MPLEALRHDITPTGLHYLLIHYDIPVVDPATWRLEIGGAVGRPLRLDLDDLLARPAVSMPVTMECAGNGRTRMAPRAISQPWGLEAVGTGEWTGTPLRPLVEEAGVTRDTVELVFTGLDRGVEAGVAQNYERSLSLDDALRDEVLLVHSLNGQPLPPQHGFPLRLLVPGWYGMASVKWLTSITAVTEPFTGPQMTRAYRLRQDSDEVGEPITRIAVRSLIAPPGVPEFLTRRRIVEPGGCLLEGRAWSGSGGIDEVLVSSDGGATWDEAVVEPAPAPYAWQRWTYQWEARPGEWMVGARARDLTGAQQPLEPRWNTGGYCNNAVQWVPVTVEV